MIVKIIKQDGTEIPFKNNGKGFHHSGPEMPPFYADLTDYRFVEPRIVDPKDVTLYGDLYEGADLMQGSHKSADRTNEFLEGRISYEGFDAARLPLVIEVDGKIMPLAGHSRINWAIANKVSSMPMYFVEDATEHVRLNAITNHLNDNAGQDIAEKITWQRWVDAGKEIIDNVGEFIPGKPNGEDTINEWLVKSGAVKRYGPVDKPHGGCGKIRKPLLVHLEKGGPKAVGIRPTSKKEQDLRENLLNGKFEGSRESTKINRKYVSVNVTSYGGNTTIHHALKILETLGEVYSAKLPYEVVVVLGSAEERDVKKIYKNRYHVANELVKDLNHLIDCVNAVAETKIAKRDYDQIQKHVKFAVFCNLTEEHSNNTNPFGFEWPIRSMTLDELKREAEAHGYKKAA